jgi:hypothetical protein
MSKTIRQLYTDANSGNLAKQEDIAQLRQALQLEVDLLRQDASARLDELGKLLRAEAKAASDITAKDLHEVREQLVELRKFAIECGVESSRQSRFAVDRLNGRFTEQLDNLRLSLNSEVQQASSRLWDSLGSNMAQTEDAQAKLLEKYEDCYSRIESLAAESSDASSELRSSVDQLCASVATMREAATTCELQVDRVIKMVPESEARMQQRVEALQGQLTRIEVLRDDGHAGLTTPSPGDGAEGAQILMRIHQKNAERRLQQIESDAEMLRESVSEALGLHTHNVEWVVPAALQKLQTARPGSLWSPKFDAGGQRGLQLEFQFLWPSCDSEVSNNGHESGNCILSLWGNKGTKVAFRLLVGTVPTGVLEHEFNERQPYRSRRLWFFDEVVNQTDGSLRLSFELLESTRSVYNVSKSSEHVSAAALGGSNERSGGSGEPVGDLISKCLGGGSGGTNSTMATEDSLMFSRNVNFRLPEVVQNEVKRMRSHAVRRVEWKIDQASTLRACFTDGKCICSMPFAAGGIDGLSLVFYPSGFKGARADYCSAFLAHSSGESLDRLHSSLRIGRHRFELEGGAIAENSNLYGRVNVCRFDQSFDQYEDFVLITFEVHEAPSELLEVSAQQDAWRSRPCSKTCRPSTARNRRGLPGRAPSAGRRRPGEAAPN